MFRQLLPYHSLLALALVIATCRAQAPLSDTLWPQWIPLAVRSPFLSTWLDIATGPESWPTFWNNAGLGWTGFISVDNSTTYGWLSPGAGGTPSAILQNVQITPTRTIMSMTAGPIDINVTYLSPIEPDDPVKQSLPFTYTSVSVASNDGKDHWVKIYCDITTEWLSSNRSADANWKILSTDGMMYHEAYLSNPGSLLQYSDQAVDGTIYFGMLLEPNPTYLTDQGTYCVEYFNLTGRLPNTVSQGPLPINVGLEHISLALSLDIGRISSTASSFVWAVGMLRDPVAQAITASGNSELRSPAWRVETSINQAQILLKQFLDDYDAAAQRAYALDLSLATRASAVSSHLVDLISLAARQVMASTELTVDSSANSLETTDIRMYMKNVGASTSPGRMNPVEGMYSAFPFFLSVNVSYGAWILKPVLDYASSPNWSYPYAPGDIGNTYPYASENSVDSSLDIEETGNMLIMVLAHARASGDGSLIGRYYQLLKTWANYLVNNTWPLRGKSVTSDRNCPANSTNLALKGIVAIAAMSQMSVAAKQDEDVAHYSSIAQLYASSWASLALGSDQHIFAAFGDPDSSWTLAYNLFADRWLGTNLFNDSLLASETQFIQHLSETTNFSSSPSVSYADADINTAWIMFTAMTMADDVVRDSLIDTLWTRLSSQLASQRLSTVLSSQPNKNDQGGSPGVGAIFAPLALAIPNITITVTNVTGDGGEPTRSTPSAGAAQSDRKLRARRIAGAAAGSSVAFAISLTAGVLLWRRRCYANTYIGKNVRPRFVAELTPYPLVPEYHGQDGPSPERQVGRGLKISRDRASTSVARGAMNLGESSGGEEMLDIPPPTYYSDDR